MTNPLLSLKPQSLSEFEYELPDSRIAKFPLCKRDSSKLLFYNKGEISHSSFADIVNVIPSHAALLFNKSKVVPARLEFLKESGTRIEVFLLEPYESEYSSTFSSKGEVQFKTLVGNKKRWKEGQVLTNNAGKFVLNANWINREGNIVNLSWNNEYSFSEVLDSIGKLPLPPYLNRDPIKSDYTTYQTVFAEEVGAVAAPTAALHFEKRELNLLQQKGISTHKMTLHVSAGTFLPVTVENVLEHPMHNEIFYYDKQDVHYLFETDFLIPVGTTSLRMAESLYWMGLALLHNKDVSFSLDKLFPYQSQFECVDKNEVKNALLSYLDSHPNQRIKASTRLMIIPGYKPQLCKGLITNFHQPCSTLVMLVASLIGNDWHKVYQSALENDYRFLSYGDSSLLIW